MAVYKNDPPTIIENTTVQPVIERETIIERDSWYSEPWAIALIIGAIAVIGLIAYWALYNPNNATPSVVENTTINRTLPDQRAQTINTPAPAPVVVNPSSPTINVTPPAASSSSNSNPPVIINNTAPSGSSNPGGGSSTPSENGSSGSNDNSGNNGPGNGGPGSGGPGNGGQ